MYIVKSISWRIANPPKTTYRFLCHLLFNISVPALVITSLINSKVFKPNYQTIKIMAKIRKWDVKAAIFGYTSSLGMGSLCYRKESSFRMTLAMYATQKRPIEYTKKM